MIKVPVKQRRVITTELKKFIPVIHGLAARGKDSSEEDARIILTDILSDALGYDKYNELRTELRERNGRTDYAVKLSEGPNAKKQDKVDFIIEAKAVHIPLRKIHVDQTLTYCLTKGLEFFILTNVMTWQLYKVKRAKDGPDAILIHEVTFSGANDPESIADDFFVFSKYCYLSEDWDKVATQAKTTNINDVAALLLSEKVVRTVCRMLEELHETKIDQEAVKELIENRIIKSETQEVNMSLLKKLEKAQPKNRRKRAVKKEPADAQAVQDRSDNRSQGVTGEVA